MVEDLALQKQDVKLCCQVLEISRSGFYAWKKRPLSDRRMKNEALLHQIKVVHEESRKTYGFRRVVRQLVRDGIKCSKNRVHKIMHANQIEGIGKRRFKVLTTDSNHDLPIANRVFKTEDARKIVTKQNQYWATDITYVPTEEGWVYLCIFLDLFTRKVIGHSMQDHMRTDLVIEAINAAVGQQGNKALESVVVHSDRGSQYASDDYRRILKAHGMIPSMSRKGNCYDNAFAETFFKSLKVELIYREKFKTKEEARNKIFEYIEVWYNRQRLHSSLEYHTPNEYEVKHQDAA